MEITKRYRIVATIGEYEKAGVMKKVYRQCGTLCETLTGPVIFMDASFNPAGARTKADGSILLSCYPEDEGEQF